MHAVVKAAAETRHLLSGNEAVARAVWEAGVKLATAYPGTPSTEILENIAFYPDLRAQWSVNEKVSLEVAIGASVVGARAFCAMKHVGMNVASDALMSQTLAGVGGGLVIAIADDVGLSSSQNEQDSRFWGRFGHLPILEPADSQEAYEMTKRAFEISEEFCTPVILRMTTRICHVKTLVTVGERVERPATGFVSDPGQWVLVPTTAKKRLPWQLDREGRMTAFSEMTDLNVEEDGSDDRVGFITSGPAYMHVRESFPDAPVFKLGFSHPLPKERLRAFAAKVGKVVVVEETEPLMEMELLAAGIHVHGKDILPRLHELTPNVLVPAVKGLLGEKVEAEPPQAAAVFPRPPTMCVGCPHLPVYYCLSRLHRQTLISGDIGCYTLGAGHPWNALDTTTCMGASITMAQGMALAKGEADEKKSVVAVIGDSTFLHMGVNGLLDLTYNKGNVTLMLLDNSATGMTGGQDHAGSGRDIHGDEAPRVDFAKLCEAVGIKKERIRVVNAYELPTLYKTIKEETAIDEPSVILTGQPCVLIDSFHKSPPLKVIDEACTGCANCLNVGCPAIHVTRRETEVRKNGKEVEKAWVTIETAACTGCDFCPQTCGPNAIVPVGDVATVM
ncbi:MAG: thiamine pyrophosphate-dependent enzyme [Rhodospirillales bacterium]|nr:thiamine pyrophosphate-dependent enzyme [Rhodospirillales bacterium]MCW8861122.1 thiamine pyrophosphate-dependent enzyme [Rhodospirillales bacterium]MCW8951861.1 thiamine pyrophosphate-dependent enzyme [Rhodospirillales bacterium]MCW8971480.1 thiamine pyrophosphate-dependent enzyme [Rhodospirillales bacterium]MCW9002852.1 thiamine pyrophosphate-dependent enzyme [Rhodospirillales bacterium]